jgi:hypothetical protein
MEHQMSNCPMIQCKYLRRIVEAVVVVLVLIGVHNQSSIAQQRSLQWFPQQRIPYYEAETLTPYLVADQDRTVHAFASQRPTEESSAFDIIYSRWTLEQGWTEPVDILIPPRGRQQARILGAVLDKHGLIHLLFFGGNDLVAEMFHTKAAAVDADQVSAWAAPVLVGEYAVTPSVAAFTVDSQGYLYVLYSGNLDGNGLYAAQSVDSGDTWSEPVPIFFTYDDRRWPLGVQLHVDQQDRVHAVWAVVNSTGNSEAIYYAQLESAQFEWSEPLLLSDAVNLYFETDTPNIIEYNDELLVIYHYDQPTTRWLRRSSDGGITWTEPVRAFPEHIGSNGPVSFVIDSNNVLHALFGNRTGLHPADHGMWHSTWDGHRWGPPRAIVSAKVRSDFDPSFARAIISQGNVMLVTWMTDPGKLIRGAWYSYAVLDTPELPAMPFPTSTATPLPLPTATAVLLTPTPVPTLPPIQSAESIQRSSTTNNPTTVLVLSIVPVTILILSVIAFHNFGNYRRR